MCVVKIFLLTDLKHLSIVINYEAVDLLYLNIIIEKSSV